MIIRTAIFVIALVVGCNARAAGTFNATSPVGTNLEAVAYYSAQWAFVDAFRASSPWISGSATAWDDSKALTTDANGWITSLQPGQIARTLMFGGMKSYPAGTYVVLYDGEGTLQYARAATLDAAQSRPGRHVLQVDPSKGGIALYITATTLGNPIRNIRVIMPGGICTGDPYRLAANQAACASAQFLGFETYYASVRFHPVFLERTRTYRALRFMDWGRTNNSTQANWADRPKLTHARWSTDKGVPVEVMLDLANRLGADPWFALPHLANDDYVRQYAKLVSAKLVPGLKAYVEYSSEVWSSPSNQASYAQSQGQALGLSTNAFQAQLFFYAKRSVEIFNIWNSEMANSARLVRVLSMQASNVWGSTQMLDFQNAGLQTDALAVSPYFGYYLGTREEQSRVQSLSLNALFAEINSRAVPEAIQQMVDQAAQAQARGLSLIAYEGGQHLVGLGGVENNAAINALFDQANRDPRMRDVYKTYLDGWRASGGRLMAHYADVGVISKWGRWGALEYMEQPRAAAPKFDALQNFIEQNPAWW